MHWAILKHLACSFFHRKLLIPHPRIVLSTWPPLVLCGYLCRCTGYITLKLCMCGSVFLRSSLSLQNPSLVDYPLCWNDLNCHMAQERSELNRFIQYSVSQQVLVGASWILGSVCTIGGQGHHGPCAQGAYNPESEHWSSPSCVCTPAG